MKDIVLKLKVKDSFERGKCNECPIAFEDWNDFEEHFEYVCPLVKNPTADNCPFTICLNCIIV